MNIKEKTSLRWINKARDFFKRIHLPFEIEPSYVPDPDCQFKGVWIADGKLHFVPARVDVGELLHEAGHLALQPKKQWRELPSHKWVDIYPPLGFFKHLGDYAVEAWDYAAALEAGIPELAVFYNGFNGRGLQVWESFDCRMHPGFTLLRFLGMSSKWGQCDRWLVGNAQIEESDEAVIKLFSTCTKAEIDALYEGSRMMLNKPTELPLKL